MFNFVWHGDPLLQRVYQTADQRMMLAGVMMVERARELAPVHSGELRDSIGFIYRQSDRVVQLYADAPYAIFVEFGTYFMKARPYLRPAMAMAAVAWGGEMHLAFKNAPILKTELASPKTRQHRNIMAHNRAVGTHFNRGSFGRVKMHIR